MKNYELATFAGGCFWCMVKPFDQYDGVIKVISGYTGGHLINPTYQQVCKGDTGHTEAVQITYDPNKISYSQLLSIFWQQIDPIKVAIEPAQPFYPAEDYHQNFYLKQPNHYQRYNQLSGRADFITKHWSHKK